MPIAVVSGADRNIGLEIVKQFLQRGWKVFAGRYLMDLPLLEELQEKYSQQLTLVPLDVSDEESVDAAAKIVAEKADRVDLLVHNAAVFGGGRDEAAVLRLLGGRCGQRCAQRGCMSKTALDMALRLMFNQLQPMGYSFRLFHPGWVRSPKIEHSTDAIPTFRDQEGNLTGKFWPWETAAAAVPQFIEDREFEDRLVLIDNEGAAWPF